MTIDPRQGTRSDFSHDRQSGVREGYSSKLAPTDRALDERRGRCSTTRQHDKAKNKAITPVARQSSM